MAGDGAEEPGGSSGAHLCSGVDLHQGWLPWRAAWSNGGGRWANKNENYNRLGPLGAQGAVKTWKRKQVPTGQVRDAVGERDSELGFEK